MVRVYCFRISRILGLRLWFRVYNLKCRVNSFFVGFRDFKV